jgi:hypothetical protein
MTTKTDLGSLTLTNSEAIACQGKAVNAPMLLIAARESAQELANLLGELIKVLPAGSNATALAAIRSALL